MSSLSSLLVMGTGLIGTSIALAAREAGVTVWIDDVDQSHLATAVALGAGRPWSSRGERAVGGPVVDHAVVCVPPSQVVTTAITASTVASTVSDICGVKANVLRDLQLCDVGEQFCGGHPMAGREQSGPWHARSDLFRGRPWVLVPSRLTSAVALQRARELAELCGAEVLVRTAEAHDRAVATVSQLPQLLASALAARLRELPADELALVGQGGRDMTRIAASPPDLWGELVALNAPAIAPALDALLADLGQVRSALADLLDGGERGNGSPGPPGIDTRQGTGRRYGGGHPDGRSAATTGAGAGSWNGLHEQVRAAVTELITRGNEGRARLPGVHGGPRLEGRSVLVAVPDQPGELARVLSAVAGVGANVADIRVDHAPGRPLGVAELLLDPADEPAVLDVLRAGGWTVTVGRADK